MPKIIKNISIFLNHIKYTIIINIITVAYLDLDITYILCLDSGSPYIIINKSTLAKIFLDMLIQPILIGKEVTLNRIGDSGPKVDILAIITIRIWTIDKHLITFLLINILVINYLLYKLLFRIDFLNKNKIGLLFKSPNSFI